MQICMLMSLFYLLIYGYSFSVGMKCFLMRSRQWSFSMESRSVRYFMGIYVQC